MSLLEVKNITKKFGGLTAVSDVNLSVNNNELIGLIGPNGAGKTTLFNLLTGVYQPTEGEINLSAGYEEHGWYGESKNLEDEEYEEEYEEEIVSLLRRRPDQIASLGIARTFQNIRLFKDITVMDNVLIGFHQKNNIGTIRSIFRFPSFFRSEYQLRDEALNLLSIFNLEDKADTLASNLPYGQQRRLEIVRALATKPKLLFLDEPAAGMNPQESADLTKLIKDIQEKFNLTVILIEHDMSVVMNVCERIYVLEHGRLIAQGSPEEVRANPEVLRAYLGEEK